MVILDVILEVPGKVLDALAKQSDLHLRRAGIRLMNPELLDDFLFLLWSNSHVFRFFLSFLFFS